MPLDLPVHSPDHGLPSRPVGEVRALAVVVQANLVQLKVADAKRRGIPPDEHELHVPPPGAVTSFREALIDPGVIARYSDLELRLRLHEVWGQFCMLRWLFRVDEVEGAVTLARLPVDADMHCGPVLEVKQTELHALLWRIQFESQRRHDVEFSTKAGYTRLAELAGRIPAEAFGQPIERCSDEEVLVAGCEHAGMLAMLRWVMDRTTRWGDPALMTVAEEPF